MRFAVLAGEASVVRARGESAKKPLREDNCIVLPPSWLPPLWLLRWRGGRRRPRPRATRGGTSGGSGAILFTAHTIRGRRPTVHMPDALDDAVPPGSEAEL
jgi:hypothetical protein